MMKRANICYLYFNFITNIMVISTIETVFAAIMGILEIIKP